jgi:hypothetical protein
MVKLPVWVGIGIKRLSTAANYVLVAGVFAAIPFSRRTAL